MIGIFQPPDGGAQLIAVFIKQTWRMLHGVPLQRADADQPLHHGTVLCDEEGTRTARVCLHDCDLWESKPWTDVVIQGTVRSAEPTTSMIAGVELAGRQKWIRVYGDREVEPHPARDFAFSPPRPFTEMPLTWRRAYGGIDATVPHEPVAELGGLLRKATPEAHPGAYPRNPAGRGYVVNDVGLDVFGLELPNFETPGHELQPETLILGDAARWPERPVPAGFGWIKQNWFPRRCFVGLDTPAFDGQARDLPEVQSGWLEPEHVTAPQVDYRLQSGASHGMRFNRLPLGQPFRLRGFTLDGELRSALPSRAPEVLLAFDRSPVPVHTRLSTLELLPDEGLANLVWVARALAPQRLPRRMPRPGETQVDWLDGIDVLVDGLVMEQPAPS